MTKDQPKKELKNWIGWCHIPLNYRKQARKELNDIVGKFYKAGEDETTRDLARSITGG